MISANQMMYTVNHGKSGPIHHVVNGEHSKRTDSRKTSMLNVALRSTEARTALPLLQTLIVLRNVAHIGGFCVAVGARPEAARYNA